MWDYPQESRPLENQKQIDVGIFMVLPYCSYNDVEVNKGHNKEEYNKQLICTITLFENCGVISFLPLSYRWVPAESKNLQIFFFLERLKICGKALLFLSCVAHNEIRLRFVMTLV